MFARMKVKLCLVAVGLVFGACLQLQAMDRWSALSQIESGDDDHAVGAAGEISRYQLKPEVWRRYAPANADWTNPDDALSVARQAMQERCAAFERAVRRSPTDSEFYILWNAPAQIGRRKAVFGRAERFCNLCERLDANPRRGFRSQGGVRSGGDCARWLAVPTTCGDAKSLAPSLQPIVSGRSARAQPKHC